MKTPSVALGNGRGFLLRIVIVYQVMSQKSVKRMSVQKRFIFLFLALFCIPVLVHGEQAKYRFKVIDIQDQTGKKAWEDNLVAYGIKSIVSDELYKTGKYIPVDDNLAITKRTKEMTTTNREKKEHAAYKSFFTDRSDCDALITVIVRKFKIKRCRSIGIFAAAKTTVEVVVGIKIKHRDGHTITLQGSGKGVTKSLGVLFQIRDDKVYFNKTTVGQATLKAIHNAIFKIN